MPAESLEIKSETFGRRPDDVAQNLAIIKRLAIFVEHMLVPGELLECRSALLGNERSASPESSRHLSERKIDAGE